MVYSTACWNTSVAVYREIKNMNIKSSKLISLKGGISMRVIGLGW